MAKDEKPRGPVVTVPLAQLFPDRPVDDGEPLQFDFEGPARTLAELALNPANRTPFAVVVKGGWGRGKTTLLRRAKWLLEPPGEVSEAPGLRRVETLWFNAWKYPSEDTVLAGLLGALLDRLRKGAMVDQLKLLVDSYKGSLIGQILLWAAPAPVKDLLLGKDGLRSRFSPAEQKRAFHDSFRELFCQVSHLLFDGKAGVRDTASLGEETLWTRERQERQTLAIFLDDLDRCRPERVAEVLEAINLFLDLPGVCFFLGIDWDRLVNALPDPMRSQGDQYLEKIVQVALDLPSVSSGGAEGYIRSLVGGTGLGESIGAGGAGGEAGAISAALASRHPRHVKRFLNDLSLGLAVLRNAGKLGDGDDQVSAGAVVAWHLLGELLPAGEWRELRALVANAQGWLRRAEGELGREKGEVADEGAEAGTGLLRSGRLGEASLRALTGLSEGQLHVLVHLASPATVVAPRRATAGKFDLFDLTSGAWVHLMGGTFRMGSESGASDEKPVHAVTLSPFAISKHPMTNAEYEIYVREAGKEPPRHWESGVIPEGKANHPVVHVSWNDAEAFATWLGARLAKGGGEGEIALPTEAQWEFAARGAEGREYPWGDEPPDATRANFGGQVGDTTAVGAYPAGATPEGVHDLAGNVWEWCRDWKGPYPQEAQRDPTGPQRGSSRVLRGGAFNYVPRNLRGAFRFYNLPEYRNDYCGFRVVWRRSAAGLE